MQALGGAKASAAINKGRDPNPVRLQLSVPYRSALCLNCLLFLLQGGDIMLAGVSFQMGPSLSPIIIISPSVRPL